MLFACFGARMCATLVLLRPGVSASTSWKLYEVFRATPSDTPKHPDNNQVVSQANFYF